MTQPAGRDPRAIALRRGFQLEWFTFGWNVVGVVVLVFLAIQSASVAIAGFGLDSLIEIGASVVVIWELSSTGLERRRRALLLIAVAFIALALYLAAQSVVALVGMHHASHSVGGIVWTAITAAVMFVLASGKTRTGQTLDNRVLLTEGRVTFIDGLLAVAVLLGLTLNFAFGWWWADPVAGLVIGFYATREAIHILRDEFFAPERINASTRR